MFLLFFVVWVILNGKVTVEICVFGVCISAALFYFICRFMDYSVRREMCLFRLIPLLIRYFGVLVEEIVKANMAVMKLIISPVLWPEPVIVYFDTDFKSDLSRVILADSITLTPGTITVSVEGNRFCVHCLDKELAKGLEDSVFVRMIKEIEAEEMRWK